ncbi:MAG TPA: sugar phosphate isomerase/epimerase family protein [Bryobacteraceae bacterium]
MKFGANTFIWSGACDQTVEDVLPLIKEHGFDGVELPLFRPADFPAARFRKAAEANGLEINFCSVLVDGLSLISDEPGIHRNTVERLKAMIQTAAEVNAAIIAGPLYSPVGFLPGRRRTGDEWKRAVEGYQALGDTLAACRVQLAIEPLNRFETFFLNTAEDARRLSEQVAHPNIGILFDTFHANIEEKDIGAGLRTVGKHLKHVHTCENDRGTPGSGHVEWDGVFQALAELRYDGWLTIESFGFALEDISAAAAIWRDIEQTPSAIAFDGIEFLKKNVARQA